MSRAFIAVALVASHLVVHFCASRAFGDEVSAAESLAGDFATCEKNFETAKSACTDPKSAAGMSNGNAATLAAQMSTMTTLVASASGTKAAAQACLISNGISAALQTINALKGDACSRSRSKCLNACKSSAELAAQQLSSGAVSPTLERQKKTAERDSKSCDAYASQVSNSLAQALTIAQSLAQAYSCYEALSSSSTTATATPIELATSVADCSNASYAATNLVCVCQNDPTNVLCGGLSANGTSSTSGITGDATTPSFAATTEDGTEVDTTPIGAVGTTGSNAVNSAGGGSGLAGGAGSVAPVASASGVEDSAGIDKNVITGTSGSGAGLSGLAAGSGGSAGKAVSANLGSGSSSGFDLKKYLPKSQLRNRGLAGMTLPSTDGITGPMGPSLWEKVSNRYQAVKPSLLPEK